MSIKRDNTIDSVRLQTADEVIYGNRDKDKIYPIDARDRFNYVVYREKLALTEDGQEFSQVTTRRFQSFTPEVWERLINDESGKRRNYFERKGIKVTILHDPTVQAHKEGVKIKGIEEKVSSHKLKALLESAKDAGEYADEVKSKTKTVKATK